MTVSVPEFSRPVRIDLLGAAARSVEIAADAEERAALARRFGLVAIDRLEAKAALKLAGEEVEATGRLIADVIQSCVATGEPVEAAIEEDFTILFRPQPTGGTNEEEVELGEAELDVVFYDGASVDLGEAVAETMVLGLDPYPRAPGADAALREVGVRREGDEQPGGALSGLKDLLAGRKY